MTKRQAWLVGVYLIVWFGLFLSGRGNRDEIIAWLDQWLAPWPLWVSVLVGWLPLAIIVLSAILSALSAARSAGGRSRVPAVVAGVFTLVLAVQTGMLVPVGSDWEPATATGVAVQGGFFGAVGPPLLWGFLLMVASWLRDRVAGVKVPFGSPRHTGPRSLVGGSALAMLIGLAVALVLAG